MLGVMERARYESKSLVLKPGAGLVLYTDGVTEAMDENENLFSERRLEEFLASVNDASPEELTNALVNEVRRFSGGAPQSDDITILALRYWGTQDHVRRKDFS